MKMNSGLGTQFFRNFPVLHYIDKVIFNKREQFLSGYIKPHIPKGKRLLDLGAGDGLLISSLAKETKAKSVYAFDIDEHVINDFKVESYDGLDIPLKDSSVDVTLCVTTLHHCDDMYKFIQEIHRVTTEYFILIEDRFDSFIDRFWVVAFHYYLKLIDQMPFNKNNFKSRNQWQKILLDSGFEVVEIIRMGRSIPFFPENILYLTKPIKKIYKEKPQGNIAQQFDFV